MSETVLRNQLQALEAKIVRLEATLSNERRGRAHRPPEMRLLLVHAAYTYAGKPSKHKYVVKVLMDPQASAPVGLAGNLAMPEDFVVPDGDFPALGLDIAANGLPHNQILAFPVYRLGVFVGTTAPEGDRTAGGNRVYAFVGAGDVGVFLVQLSKDGGDDGDGTTAPTYTYTVTRDGTQLGTAASPVSGRTNGSFTEATRGLGTYMTGAFTLLYAFEKPATFEQDCEGEEP